MISFVFPCLTSKFIPFIFWEYVKNLLSQTRNADDLFKHSRYSQFLWSFFFLWGDWSLMSGSFMLLYTHHHKTICLRFGNVARVRNSDNGVIRNLEIPLTHWNVFYINYTPFWATIISTPFTTCPQKLLP